MLEDLNKKLGQLFFIGFQGNKLSKETRKIFRMIQPGAIIFFESNIKNKNQVKKLIKEINNCLEIKPFIAIDQEGGSVERLRNICTSLPSVWGLSKVGLKALISAQKIIAQEIRELGFNMILGPVLDINSNVRNPIIGTRAISNKPKLVATYGKEIVNFFLKQKIIPVPKHFPGHGDLKIDSHLGLPILNKSKTELKNFELVPFKKVIKEAPAIMVGHIHPPKLERDKNKPASLSKSVLQGLLRDELHFKGLIITDELNMKAITKTYNLTNASSCALASGANLILFNENLKSTSKVYTYIKGKLTRDKDLLNAVNNSYKRIIAIKNKHLNNKRPSGIKIKQNQKNALELALKVVHWVKRDLFFQPLDKNEPIEVIFPNTPKLKINDLIKIFKVLKIKNYHLSNYDLNPQNEEITSITKKLNNKTRKILLTYDIAVRKQQNKLVKNLLSLYSDLVVIATGLEYDIELAPEVKNFIAAYAPNYVSLLVAFKNLLKRI